MSNKKQHYMGNPNLKAAGVQIEFELGQMKEYARCAKDPVYFIENYCKIVSLDNGAVLFKMFPYQRRIIKALHGNRKIIAKLFRQSGKSTVIAAYVAWYICFNEHKTVAILANKAAIAREIFSRVQFIFENLPFWLQQGVIEWNKTSFEMENGSKCFCAASSPSSIRGKSINFLMCVSGDTEITVRDKLTGFMTKTPIEKICTPDIGIQHNNKYEVLSDTGWSNFSGVKIDETQAFIKIKFVDGSSLKCTTDHRLMMTSGKWCGAASLVSGDFVKSDIGDLEVMSTDIVEGGLTYDLIGVEKNSRYYTNGVISHNCDEFAHLPPNLAEEFIASVFPTISSSQESKLVLVSTPNGMNQFYKLWIDAEKGRNGFVPCQGTWKENPLRNQKWADEQLTILGKTMYFQEIECVGGDTIVEMESGKIRIADVEFSTKHEKVLTPSGFKQFSGIKKKTVDHYRTIEFADGTKIDCTHNHTFVSEGKNHVACLLYEGVVINGKTITSVIDKEGPLDVYDLVEVEGGNLYYTNGLISHNCSFVGSSKTLVDGTKLSTIPFVDPIYESDKLKIFEKPIVGHNYVCTVDTSRGQHLDYSAFMIFDITVAPYRVVATYKDNSISTMAYPTLIQKLATQYNEAYCLVEVNDAGGEVANTLFYEFEYPNVYWTSKEVMKEGGETGGYPGVRTTKKVKSVGCSVLKELIEQDQLVLNSFDILSELNVFTLKGASYGADDTMINDDLTTCLWLFAWMTKQSLFSDLNNTNIRSILAKKTEAYINDNMLPVGFFNNGIEEEEEFSAVTISYHGESGDPLASWMSGF